MRDHANVSPAFWIGETGRELRKDADAQRIAFYLMTCPSSNMIGLYYLPISTIAHELGSPFEGASKGLRRVCETGFAAYDYEAEVVFVFEMAKWQVAPELKPSDNRIKSIEKQLSAYRKSIFYNDFLSRYREPFNLTLEPVDRSPFEAPSKPLRSQEQEQEQEQDKELPSEVCTEPPASLPEPSKFRFLVKPSKGKPATVWVLPQAEFDKYAAVYGEGVASLELGKAELWCSNNATRRKTAGGMLAFLTKWLNRAANMPAPRGSPAEPFDRRQYELDKAIRELEAKDGK